MLKCYNKKEHVDFVEQLPQVTYSKMCMRHVNYLVTLSRYSGGMQCIMKK